MSGLALAYTILSSLGWAGFDATRKVLSSRVPAVPLVVLLMVGQLPFFGAWIAWDHATLVVGPGFWTPALASVALNVAANLLFLKAVRESPLSLTIPMLSLSPAFAAVAEFVGYGAAPTGPQWLGMGIVILGAITLHAGGQAGADPRAVVRQMLQERGSLWMAVVALLWAVSGTFDKAATSHATAAVAGFAQCAGVALCLAVWMVARRETSGLRAIGSVRGVYVLSIASGVLALGVQLLAYQLALVGLVEAVKRAVGMLTSLALGRVVFGERIGLTQVAAVLVMAVGVALIAI